MSTRPEEILQKMIESLKETTGRSLDEWQTLITDSGLQKHGEVMAFLKTDHGISHGYANQIALRRTEGAAAQDADPMAAIFASRDLAREIYEALMVRIRSFGEDVDVAPKRAYVSLRRRKQFAILQPASNRLDVGINLPNIEATDRLEASGSFNAMLSHRVRVTSVAEIDDELVGWLRDAYSAA